MITVSNVSVQFGKRVLFNDVNLKFTSLQVVTVMVLSVRTVRENLRFFVRFTEIWTRQQVRLRSDQANVSLC